MDNENGLQQLTVRLPLNVKEKIENLAKNGGCSTAEIIRRAVDGNLNKYLDNVQYVDREQGEAIKKQLENLFTEISGMRMELNRIGVNYNQEVRLREESCMYISLSAMLTALNTRAARMNRRDLNMSSRISTG